MEDMLIDAIYNTLKRDDQFMAFFGLSPSSPSESIVTRIVRGIEPDKAVTGKDVPMMLIYLKPGRFSRNYLVYEGKFCLDVYGKNRNQAKQIADRAFRLFHDQQIRDENYLSSLCSLAYEADFATGITGVKGYEIIFDVNYHRIN
ncbi:hypothetical protein GNQ08_27240 [Paenibacillus macerans]|uniref:DUF3168 domain-containing protein n=1 Tax=Paenibacillus macerans TaxID=44252 RepID=A0A6N8F5Y1_PAEMA|nr:hypothetical protein [Paenibacillus macerans]MUG26061.1 hypothetical protein [Paenibacillus macerans]OMG47268.1 hypothetical protein BK140_22425 [Paenibacillus macerans]